MLGAHFINIYYSLYTLHIHFIEHIFKRISTHSNTNKISVNNKKRIKPPQQYQCQY